LPEDIGNKCLDLMRKLGLNYGALDFCITPEGEHVFFEINCAGQYLWVEERTQMPISQELALLLTGKSPPLVSSLVAIG
jgi:D-alanine-D-alanine ligase-like ATP-grasp enzyme